MPLFNQVVSNASEDRLERMIAQRVAPGTTAEEKAEIDRRIWNLFGERWAVMFTDLSGFSRRVAEFGIIHFLQTIHESHRILVPCIEHHGGILLKLEGDSMLVIFRDPQEALSAAVEMQRCCAEYNDGTDPEERILMCIGLGFGDVLRIGDRDVFGAEVNAAAKLGEDKAEAFDILVTGNFHEAVKATDDVDFVNTGVAAGGAATSYKARYKL
jgi:adenylate cyclase